MKIVCADWNRQECNRITRAALRVFPKSSLIKCFTAEEAYQQIRVHKPDLLITEMTFDGEPDDGAFLAAYAQDWNPEAVTIFWTGTPKKEVEHSLAEVRKYVYLRRSLLLGALKKQMKAVQKKRQMASTAGIAD